MASMRQSGHGGDPPLWPAMTGSSARRAELWPLNTKSVRLRASRGTEAWGLKLPSS